MKKVTLTTEKVLTAFNVLKGASYQKMTDDDKIKLWKIARSMKPIATKFEEDSKDAAEKLKRLYSVDLVTREQVKENSFSLALYLCHFFALVFLMCLYSFPG